MYKVVKGTWSGSLLEIKRRRFSVGPDAELVDRVQVGVSAHLQYVKGF